MPFEESKHRRGQPKNKGQFGPGGSSNGAQKRGGLMPGGGGHRFQSKEDHKQFGLASQRDYAAAGRAGPQMGRLEPPRNPRHAAHNIAQMASGQAPMEPQTFRELVSYLATLPQRTLDGIKHVYEQVSSEVSSWLPNQGDDDASQAGQQQEGHQPEHQNRNGSPQAAEAGNSHRPEQSGEKQQGQKVDALDQASPEQLHEDLQRFKEMKLQLKSSDPQLARKGFLLNRAILEIEDRLKKAPLKFARKEHDTPARFSWDASKHPRGQPDNKGQFVEASELSHSIDTLIAEGKIHPQPDSWKKAWEKEDANLLEEFIDKRQKNAVEDPHAGQMLYKLQLSGGFTYKPVSNKFKSIGEQGFAVSPYPSRTQIFEGNITAEDITKFIKKNQDLLQKPDHAIGAWKDTETNKIYLDVTIITENRDEAIRLGKKHNQISIFDFANGETIDTGGTGEDRDAHQPERNRRRNPKGRGAAQPIRMARYSADEPRRFSWAPYRYARFVEAEHPRAKDGKFTDGKDSEDFSAAMSKMIAEQKKNESSIDALFAKYHGTPEPDEPDYQGDDPPSFELTENTPGRQIEVETRDGNKISIPSDTYRFFNRLSGINAPSSGLNIDNNASLPAATRAYLSALTPQQAYAIHRYTNEDFSEVDSVLRNGKEKFLKTNNSEELQIALAGVRLLNKAFENTPVSEEPITVYRGEHADYSTAEAKSMLSHLLECYENKKPFSTAGFLSTSTDSEWLKDKSYKILFEIKAHRGIDVRPLSQLRNENEFLMNHDSKFQVTGHQKTKDGRDLFELEQIE